MQPPDKLGVGYLAGRGIKKQHAELQLAEDEFFLFKIEKKNILTDYHKDGGEGEKKRSFLLSCQLPSAPETQFLLRHCSFHPDALLCNSLSAPKPSPDSVGFPSAFPTANFIPHSSFFRRRNIRDHQHPPITTERSSHEGGRRGRSSTGTGGHTSKCLFSA